jgi:hypothetical protein
MDSVSDPQALYADADPDPNPNPGLKLKFFSEIEIFIN